MKKRSVVLAEGVRGYRVVELNNTVEWAIGDLLTKKQVEDILCRVGERHLEVKIREEK